MNEEKRREANGEKIGRESECRGKEWEEQLKQMILNKWRLNEEWIEAKFGLSERWRQEWEELLKRKLVEWVTEWMERKEIRGDTEGREKRSERMRSEWRQNWGEWKKTKMGGTTEEKIGFVTQWLERKVIRWTSEGREKWRVKEWMNGGKIGVSEKLRQKWEELLKGKLG